MGKDVDLTIEDGGLGVVTEADGILAVVGVGAAAVSGIVLATRDNYESKAGLSPIRDFLEQVFSLVDTPVYCRILAASTAGELSAVAAGSGNAGVGGLAVSGSPYNRFDVSVDIEGEGGLNEATFRYTLDGIQSSIITVPESGAYLISEAGITLTFSAGSPTGERVSFAAGDSFSFTSTAPTASNAELLAAVDDLIASSYLIRHISVAAVTQAAFWSAFAAKLLAAEASHKYISGSTMARYITSGETLDEYVAALIGTERGSVSSVRLMVCAHWIEENDVSGYVDIRNGLGKIIGRMFAINIALSPGATKLGAVDGVERIMPETADGNPFPSAHIDSLEDAGYATFRYYDGKSGVYINDSTLMSEDGSDFTICTRIDVLNKARNLVREAQFPFIKDNFDVLDDGSVPQLEAVKAAGEAQLKIMQKDKEISSGRIEMSINQNILSNPVVTEKVYVTPRGSFTEISGTIQFENPALEED